MLSRNLSWLCMGLLLAVLTPIKGAEPLPERWIYATARLHDDAGLEKFQALLKQAKATGCTHVLLIEGRWLKFPDDAKYQARADQIKATAKDLGLILVPGIFSIGYSGRYFHFDPNLIAGLPVKEMPFVVKGASAAADPAGAPDLSTLKPDGNGFNGTLKVKSFQHYKLTFDLKGKYTGDADELIRVNSGDGKRWISRTTPHVNREAEAQTVVYTFNSLESAEVRLRLRPGAAKLENLKLELAGTLLLARRPLIPLTVASEDGKTVYEEGKDFKPLHDADMLKKPFDGEFTINRKPADIELIEGSRIKDGDKLKVSFWHGLRVGTDQDVISLEDPKTMEVLEIDLKNCIKVWQPQAFMLNYDEIRVAGWEPQPDGKQLKPGELLAQHFKRACELVRKHVPNAKLYTWSDMFTPHHNARPFSEKGYYYLVNGNWDGAWEGVDKDIGILNWYAPKTDGIKFFADRGHEQILCGFYDVKTTEQMKNNIGNWMKVSAGQPKIHGFMYTTWHANYKHLDEYFKLVDAYETWGLGGATKTEKEPGVKE